jgi:hypothetical protein
MPERRRRQPCTGETRRTARPRRRQPARAPHSRRRVSRGRISRPTADSVGGRTRSQRRRPSPRPPRARAARCVTALRARAVTRPGSVAHPPAALGTSGRARPSLAAAPTPQIAPEGGTTSDSGSLHTRHARGGPRRVVHVRSTSLAAVCARTRARNRAERQRWPHSPICSAAGRPRAARAARAGSRGRHRPARRPSVSA